MMTVTTTAFHGTIRAAAPARYTVRCLTCRAVVGFGADSVDLDGLQHDCPDTTAGTREWEVTFTDPEANADGG
jgi:hypothetical protein